MVEPENWRGGWFHSFGSRCIGPFLRRGDASAAKNRDFSMLDTCHQPYARLRGQHAVLSGVGVNTAVEPKRNRCFGGGLPPAA